MIDKAFILAAGLGKRLRPYTESTPKPLVKVAGSSLLERTLAHLREAGIREATINLHYLGGQIEQRLAPCASPHLSFSFEPELLDTGGGIKNALANFKGEDFFVLPGDGLWENGPSGNTLELMRKAWDPTKMDILILLQPLETMALTHGVGDYDIDPETGRASRSRNQSGAYMWTSIRINRSAIFDTAPDGPFSYLTLLDKAEAKGRLYALIHDGDWHHISTPKDLESVDAAYRAEGGE